MIEVATRYTRGVRDVLDSRRLPWSIAQLGARAEYRFCASAPVSGGQSAAAAAGELDEYLHLYTINRGILMTPFHNMALMCPATTASDADAHTAVFAAAADDLVGLPALVPSEMPKPLAGKGERSRALLQRGRLHYEAVCTGAVAKTWLLHPDLLEPAVAEPLSDARHQVRFGAAAGPHHGAATRA